MKHWTRREFGQRALATGVIFSGAGKGFAQLQLSTTASAKAADNADPYRLVDPELVPILKTLPQLTLSPEMLATVRTIPLKPPLPPPLPQPVSRMIPGAAGAPDIHLVIVDPAPGAKNRPVIVHTHGGGYVAANTSLYPFIQNMAQACQCVVVSVDYRMAPETRFPGSLEDNYAALRWVHAHAAELGIDRARIAVGGESAGGGHAAALALRARDRAEIPVIFQLLLYPMLDDRTGSTKPAPPTMGQFVWTAASNRFGWTALLGTPAGSAQVPAGSVPARVEDLSGLPPAWIGVGSIDLFADEDVIYAKRLMDSGVSTELNVFPGGYHAFDLLVPDAKTSQRFTESWRSALRRAFANG